MDLSTAFAQAVAAKDADRLAGLLAPEIDFRGMTPNRNWEASDADTVVEIVLSRWFEPSDEIEELVEVKTGSVGDRDWLAYRIRGRNARGPFLVEQNAFFTEREERIEWMRVLCSGFRPLEPG